jgi:hypothetical protein
VDLKGTIFGWSRSNEENNKVRRKAARAKGKKEGRKASRVFASILHSFLSNSHLCGGTRADSCAPELASVGDRGYEEQRSEEESHQQQRQNL